jgi:hypothetical protein
MTMSVTITDEQYSQIEFYLNGIRTGEAYEIMQSTGHRDAIAKLMEEICPPLILPTADETEASIRAQLLIWSQPSCP